jgi:hypothetical protein
MYKYMYYTRYFTQVYKCTQKTPIYDARLASLIRIMFHISTKLTHISSYIHYFITWKLIKYKKKRVARVTTGNNVYTSVATNHQNKNKQTYKHRLLDDKEMKKSNDTTCKISTHLLNQRGIFSQRLSLPKWSILCNSIDHVVCYCTV